MNKEKTRIFKAANNFIKEKYQWLKFFLIILVIFVGLKSIITKIHSDNKVEWVDVTNNQEAQKITSKTYKELLRRMHVIQDGKVINGAESFLIIWKNIPKYNFLYKIFKIKPLFFLLGIFYEIAAYFLFVKNKHLLKK